MIRGLSFAFILLLAGSSYAQQSCSQRLNRAEDLYDEGRLLEIPGMLTSCLEDDESFTEGEKIRARKLLTKVYIFTDNEVAAEEEFVNLLTVDPVHQLQAEDPTELRVLMNKFRTWPIYRIEVKVGGNYALTNVESEFSAFSVDQTTKDYGDSPGIGIQIEANVTRHWKNGIEFGSGLQFRSTNYTVKSIPGGGVFETDLKNSQAMLRIPLFARYNFNYDNREGMLPYVFAGGTVDLLLSAKYSEGSRSGGTSYTIDSDNGDLKAFGQVNNTNFSLFGGVGLKFRMKKGNFFFGEVRYDKSMMLYNVPEERYANPAVNGDLQFVEDDLFLNFVSINFGFIKSMFNPEKLTK